MDRGPVTTDHVHELVHSELVGEDGLYCWLCSKDFEDIDDDDEVVMK